MKSAHNCTRIGLLVTECAKWMVLTWHAGVTVHPPPLLQGVCSFAEKAWHAEQAGAIAVLIYDSDRANDDKWVDMVQENEGYDVTIPSMFVLGREGHKIADGLAAIKARSATITIPVNETHISPHEYFPGVLW
jgi:hypothetical protein